MPNICRMRMATVFGGVGERPQIEALRSGVEMVVATPGRLLDLLNQRHGDFSGVEFLVLDEADRMLDMGFLPQIRARGEGAARASARRSCFPPRSRRRSSRSRMNSSTRRRRCRSAAARIPAETVTQLVYEVPASLKPVLLAHLLQDAALDSVLVFTRTKHGADRIARRLESSQIRTATLHSNRSQNQRLRALKEFKSGEVRVLVATDIAARGIDVDGISHVINYDFPMHSEDYVHRIGRTGRAQAVGDAISFVTPEDQGALRSLERFIGRGLVRKRAEGFDYAAKAPAEPQRERRVPPNRPPRAAKTAAPPGRRGMAPAKAAAASAIPAARARAKLRFRKASVKRQPRQVITWRAAVQIPVCHRMPWLRRDHRPHSREAICP